MTPISPEHAQEALDRLYKAALGEPATRTSQKPNKTYKYLSAFIRQTAKSQGQG